MSLLFWEANNVGGGWDVAWMQEQWVAGNCPAEPIWQPSNICLQPGNNAPPPIPHIHPKDLTFSMSSQEDTKAWQHKRTSVHSYLSHQTWLGPHIQFLHQLHPPDSPFISTTLHCQCPSLSLTGFCCSCIDKPIFYESMWTFTKLIYLHVERHLLVSFWKSFIWLQMLSLLIDRPNSRSSADTLQFVKD